MRREPPIVRIDPRLFYEVRPGVWRPKRRRRAWLASRYDHYVVAPLIRRDWSLPLVIAVMIGGWLDHWAGYW